MGEVGMPLVILGLQLQHRYVSPGNTAHFSIDVVVILVGKPVGHAILDRFWHAFTCVELREKVPGIIPTLKISGIEAIYVVVCDEGAMLDEMMIKRLFMVYY